jgi:hypothetical protein
LVDGALLAVVLVAGAVLDLGREVASDRGAGLVRALAEVFALESLAAAALVVVDDLLPAAFDVEVLPVDFVAVFLVLDLVVLVAALVPELFAAARLVGVALVLFVGLVLAGLALPVVAFLVVDFVVVALRPVFFVVVALRPAVFVVVAFRPAVFVVVLRPAGFPVEAALPVARLAVVFVVEFADVLRVELLEALAVLLREPVIALGLAAARLVALADTAVRDPLAASTCLRPAESAADTATQTPALLSKRSSFLACGAEMSAFSQTSRTSSALT